MARRNKPRKWSNLRDQIPEQPVEISERQQKVFAEKDKRATRDMHQLSAEWEALEQLDAEAAALQYARNILYDALQARMLEELAKIEQMAGTDMYRGPAGTFSPKYSPIPLVRDPEALKAWVVENQMGDLLELPHARLKSIVTAAYDAEHATLLTPAQRAQLKPGQPASNAPPPGVEVFMKTTVNHTNKKGAHRGHEDEQEGGDAGNS